MKVLHIIKSYLPITENWLYNQLIHCPDCKHIVLTEKIISQEFINPDFEYHILPEKIKSVEGNSIIHKIRRALNKYSIFRASKSDYLIEFTSSIKPDLVHFHFGTVTLEYSKFISTTQIPVVTSFYGYDYNKNINYKKLSNSNCHIICEGEAGKQEILKHGFKAKNISVVPLGIIPNTINFRQHKSENQLSLIQIASFNEKKGQFTAINAVEKIIHECPGLKLTLVGGDSILKKELMHYVETKQLMPYITFREVIPLSSLNTELSKHHGFIHLSRVAQNGDHEGGAPIVLLSAQLVGLPVISTKHQDIPTYVLNGKTGILVDENDIEAAAEAIIKMYKMSEDEFSRFSKYGKEHILNNFDIQKNALLLSQLYRKIIKPTS